MTKALLRNALRDRIPPEVLARRDKIGFATPESAWLQRPEPDEDVLSSRSFAERGYVRPERLAPLLQAHERGDTAATGALWRCVNLELWLRRFVDAPGARRRRPQRCCMPDARPGAPRRLARRRPRHDRAASGSASSRRRSTTKAGG